MLFIDANVLVDVLENDPEWAEQNCRWLLSASKTSINALPR